MPFLAQEHLPIPTTDLLSWYFDAPAYPLSKPVYISAQHPTTRFHTGAACLTLIRRLCAGFHAAGLRPGTCVGVHSFNDIDYPVLVNGIVAFGGVFAGTNPGYGVLEVAHALRAAKVEYMVVEKELLGVVVQAARDSGWVARGEDVEEVVKRRVWVFDHDGDAGCVPDGWRSWRELLGHGERDWVRFDGLEKSQSTEAARLFSSGTTGLPKAAMLSHYNLVAQRGVVNDWREKKYEIRRLLATPLFHAAIAPCVHFSALRNGVASYIMRRFELEPYLRAIQVNSITDGIFVPPLVVAIINAPHLTAKYNLKSLVHSMCGAAPLSKGSQPRFKALMRKEAGMVQVYGMTELSCIAMTVPYPDDDDTGSVGFAVPGLDVKVVDVVEGVTDITGYDVRGELCFRGPTVIKGYLGKDGEGVNRVDWDDEGYFHTGDIAYCDGKTRKWYVVDRKKELIKVRGFRVAPAELEGVLMAHPRVMDSAIIGVPAVEEMDGEAVRAYVVSSAPGPGEGELTEEDVKNWVAQKLAGYKQLTGGVVFVDVIPKNPSGKILKRVLRETAKDETRAAAKDRARL